MRSCANALNPSRIRSAIQRISGRRSSVIESRESPAAPYLAFASCSLIWGSTFLFIGFSNDALPPMWALALRLVLAGILLSAISTATRNRMPEGEALQAAIWYGILNFGISLGLLYWGETKIPTGLAAVLYSITPLATMFLATAFGLERLEWRRLAAGGIAVVGVAVIFWNELAAGRSAVGILAVLGAVFTGLLGSILVKRGPKQSSFGLNAVGSFVGFPIVLAASFFLGERHSVPDSPSEWIPLAYLVIAGSLGGFVLFAWLLQRWRTSSTAFIGVVVPIIAVILGALARNEALTPGALVGGAVVLVATVFAIRSERAT